MEMNLDKGGQLEARCYGNFRTDSTAPELIQYFWQRDASDITSVETLTVVTGIANTIFRDSVFYFKRCRNGDNFD